MARLSVLTWIGNAAARLCGKHGDVTEQAQQAGCSRQAVYDHADKVQRAVEDAQLPGPSRQQLLNSVVRMHQARHRNLSQELLDLKRLYWNCREFVEGKRKGHCPYELLGLKLPSCDPWVLLQMDPAQLEKLLSSSELTI